MKLTELFRGRPYLGAQREALRLLHHISDRLEFELLPEGDGVAFRFISDGEFLDRLCLLGARVEDVEGERGDDEDGDGREPDARDLEMLSDAEPSG